MFDPHCPKSDGPSILALVYSRISKNCPGCSDVNGPLFKGKNDDYLYLLVTFRNVPSPHKRCLNLRIQVNYIWKCYWSCLNVLFRATVAEFLFSCLSGT